MILGPNSVVFFFTHEHSDIHIHNILVTCAFLYHSTAKKVQSLYDSLVAKDCQIYCRRAQELHSSPDAGREELFVFSLERLQLWAMFDPSMLGRERLVKNLRDMDDLRYVWVRDTKGNTMHYTSPKMR